jgi:GNAT superfamily N-acetyltransferase
MEGRDVLQRATVAEGLALGAGICVAPEDIALRAATDADVDFLRELFSSTRIDEFARVGMPAEQIEALLVSQFSIQHDYYHQHYPNGRFDIITYRGNRVGRLYHNWCADSAQLIDIALLPAHRGAGIGSQLMRALVARAASACVPMRLYVEFDNPVRALYRRLGFVPAGENGVYELMLRDAVPFDEDGAGVHIEGLSERFSSSTSA